jgi:hypothetical protein
MNHTQESHERIWLDKRNESIDEYNNFSLTYLVLEVNKVAFSTTEWDFLPVR